MFNLGLPTTLAPAPNPVIQGMQNMALLQQQQQKAALANQMLQYNPQLALATAQQAQANPIETLAKAYNERMGGALQGAQLTSLPAQQQGAANVSNAQATQLIPAQAKMQLAQASLNQQLAQTQDSIRQKNIADAILARAQGGLASQHEIMLGGPGSANTPQGVPGSGGGGAPEVSPVTNQPYPNTQPLTSWSPSQKDDFYSNSNAPPPLPSGVQILPNNEVPVSTAQKMTAMPQAARAIVQIKTDLNNPEISKYFGSTAPALASRIAAHAAIAAGQPPPAGWTQYQSFLAEMKSSGEEIGRAMTGTNSGEMMLNYMKAMGDPDKQTVPVMQGIIDKLGRNIYENAETYSSQGFQTNLRQGPYTAAQMLYKVGYGDHPPVNSGASAQPVGNPAQMRALQSQLNGLTKGSNGQVQSQDVYY